MRLLPTWMRGALFATAAMNILVAGAFIPAAESARVLAGFPPGGHPLYLLTVGLFIFLFGVGYLWTALRGHADAMFITLAAFGKLAFVGLLTGLWAMGSLPLRAPILGSADLLFAVMFFAWLLGTPASAPAAVDHGRAFSRAAS